jgi:hypothetical protein
MTLDCKCNRLIEAEAKAAKMADMLGEIETWINLCDGYDDTEHGKDIPVFDLTSIRLDIADLLESLGYREEA